MAGVLTSSQKLRSRFRILKKASSSGTTRKGHIVTTVNRISNFCAAVNMVTATAAITNVQIIGNTTAAGDGTEYVIKETGTIAADAVNDQVVLEVTAEEIMEVMYRDPGVGDRATKVEFLSVYAKTTCNTADVIDTTTIVEDNHHQLNLTPATTIA
jgi:hypothetical protein